MTIQEIVDSTPIASGELKIALWLAQYCYSLGKIDDFDFICELDIIFDGMVGQ